MNKIVVITGASTGFGKVLARALIVGGDTVVISARRKDELDSAAAEIGATAYVADVTDEVQLTTLADFVIQKFGRIDMWVNNAGVWLPHLPAEEYDMTRVKHIFDVNVFGTMYGTRVALRLMKQQGAGTIMNIISTSGLSGRPNASMYSSSKWAVRGFTDSVREEVRDTKLRILSVYPGGMKTHLFDEQKSADFESFMTPEYVVERVVANLAELTPEAELIIKRPSA